MDAAGLVAPSVLGRATRALAPARDRSPAHRPAIPRAASQFQIQGEPGGRHILERKQADAARIGLQTVVAWCPRPWPSRWATKLKAAREPIGELRVSSKWLCTMMIPIRSSGTDPLTRSCDLLSTAAHMFLGGTLIASRAFGCRVEARAQGPRCRGPSIESLTGCRP